MNTPGLSNQRLVSDPGSLNALKFSAGQEGDKGKAALKETAKQFEALFMRELIKSMREATMKSGLLEGEGGNLGNDLLDQQFAVQLSGMPGGLSGAIERQLSRQMAPAEPAAAADAAKAAPVANAAPMASTVSRASGGTRQAGFVDQHSQAAAQVARESGIPASYMIGQAGHETGWGRSEIRHRDGSPSFNLFGIKATSAWKGKVAEITTTEYVNGTPRKTVAKFRAYDSYADSFRDYARLITKSPRYDQVMDQVGSVQGFASGLQKAGYATDPQYAAKLSRAINMTLSLQRAQV
ncbi:MAG: flagellar assembly peptidoglycan hydrolase FlgJ [Gammaproteobacteria bacterium]|uniref:flagellar assembly peptidoglycan hydrolase FlgJ n=1 Tax=Hydrogenophaga sp. TaxID=1904254 RepID=UPI000CB69391|nr:flagellar assembly peptidoglycan hydrolase FlgJ [Hydrogenophaga sp.]MBU4184151.1 flagellar assembly peptidoglycan hydrolase FlgJ [Gammaproteobacteria bacterium]PKO76172.1 MAG: flagellar assembly peptidoglycan hydrolase FlgJ [Betaproteobacteria bacterium HGW-Betaproteobacteria-15]MBU4279101.1 flagellar assembly peptidoglycan hydrolase FlgJ [Gammaproteobacteria bacterium]MBU4324777.1 flagellar assembly peptidoglycan hydrolase FlgJ [Gammaproteobacteria bacterium]MBU4507530.1 flagellar assembly